MRQFTLHAVALSVLVAAGCATIDTMERSGEGRNYTNSYDEVYTTSLEVLNEIGFVVQRDDYEKGDIRAKRTFYSLSEGCYGMIMGVFLEKFELANTKVKVQEKPILPTNMFCNYKEPFFWSNLSRRLRDKIDKRTLLLHGAPISNFQAIGKFGSEAAAQQEANARLESRLVELVNQLSTSLKEKRVVRVAVLPIEDAVSQKSTPLGIYLADTITNRLVASGLVRVVERGQLGKVIDELALSQTGKFDENSAKMIGRFVGADSIVTGTYAELGNQAIEVNARIVSIETGEVLGAGSVQFPKAAVQTMLR